MKSKKNNIEKYFPYASIIILTLYVISENKFSIYDNDLSTSITQFLLLISSMGLGFLFHILVHESGHLIFGLLSSYKFSSFRVLSFLFVKRNGKIKIERLSVAGTAGQCLMTPEDKDLGLSSALVYLLGGGLLNIIVSIALMFIHYKYFAGTAFTVLSRSVYAVGFYVAITNLIPINFSQIPTDGNNCLLLWRDRNAVRILNETLVVQDYITRGYTYTDIPNNFLYFNDKYDYNIPIYTGSLIFYHAYLLEKESYQEAYLLDKKVESNYPNMIDSYKDYFKYDLLFFDILKLENIEFLKEKYRNVETLLKQTRNSIIYLRIQYAYHSLVNKNINEGKKIEKQFFRILKVVPFEADIKIENQLFNLIKKKIHETSEITKQDDNYHK